MDVIDIFANSKLNQFNVQMLDAQTNIYYGEPICCEISYFFEKIDGCKKSDFVDSCWKFDKFSVCS